MAAAVETDVRKILSPERVEKIRKAYSLAWDDWMKGPDKAKYSTFARTRATMVFERLVARLLEVFSDDPGMKHFFKDETVKFVFDDKVVLRAKKGDERGLGSNIETQASLDFCSQQADIPGLEGHQKVDVLYLLNKTATAIENIVVQARDGVVKLWEYSLTKDAPANVIPIPLPEMPNTTAEDMVKPKKSSEKKKSDKDRE